MCSDKSKPVADTLLISADFFGYATEIKRGLERRGRTVAHFEDRPATDALTKSLIRVSPGLVRGKARAYFQNIGEFGRRAQIKDVLVIKGESMDRQSINAMRRALPNARFTLYFWDSYRNMPSDTPGKPDLFDRTFSFDIGDVADDYRLIYRPLFFIDAYRQLLEGERDIDLLFFGTMHGDRYSVLRRVAQALPADIRFERVLYFPARWLHAANAIRHPSLRFDTHVRQVFSPLSRPATLDLVRRARVVLDIERPVQTGFTMRTIEMLGAGRKLLTTNAQVLNADFYDPSNIAVLDRADPKVSRDFLRDQYRAPDPRIVDRYSLEAWIDAVLPTG